MVKNYSGPNPPPNYYIPKTPIADELARKATDVLTFRFDRIFFEEYFLPALNNGTTNKGGHDGNQTVTWRLDESHGPDTAMLFAEVERHD